MNEDDTEKAVSDALWRQAVDADLKSMKTRFDEYDRYKNNTFKAAIGLAALVLAQPFLRFWEGVIGK